MYDKEYCANERYVIVKFISVASCCACGDDITCYIKFEDFLGQVRYRKLHLSGLIGTASRPDMQKIRVIGFLFENTPHWRFEVGKNFLQTAVLGYVFIYVRIKH